MLIDIGILFIIVGGILFKFPPKKINGLYGYRTASSMESQTKWDFAQKYSSKVMMCTGFTFLIISFAKYIFKTGKRGDLSIGIMALIFGCILMIVIVEKKLKQIP